jgi:hypothetical protein
MLASDLPEGLAIARKRLATVAERRNASKRLGFAHRGAPDSPDRPAASPAADQPADRT